MTRRGRQDHSQSALLRPSPDPLLLEHLAIRSRFVEGLRRRATLGERDAGAGRVEEETAAALSRYLSHWGSLVTELLRRGHGAGEIEAAFGELAPGSGGLEPAGAFAEGAPGGARGAGMVPWVKAAHGGRAAARYVAAMALRIAPGRRADFDEAARLLESASRQQHAAAAAELALLHLEGEGEPALREEGITHLRWAAEGGDAEACWNLGLRLMSGRDLQSDTAAGLSWLERSAEAGHPEAQLELGRVHATGAFGLEVDFPLALRWLKMAAAHHRKVAADWLAKYGALTPAQYRSLTWLEYWTPDDVPPPSRSGPWGIAASAALLGLLVYGAARGNGLPLFLLLVFLAVMIHEAGHWLAGRLVGIPTLVFTVGVGPLLRSFVAGTRRHPMRIDLKLLPLLGSVQPYSVPKGVFDHWQRSDEAERKRRPPPPLPEFDREEPPEPAFLHVTRPRRLAYLAGGLAANFLVAVTGLLLYERLSDEAPLRTAPVAGIVPPGSVAASAGLVEGDRFVSVDGVPVRGFFDVQRRLAPRDDHGFAAPLPDPPGREVPMEIRRGGATLSLAWPTPPAPPQTDAEQAYGLLPPESWRIAHVQRHVQRQLSPGDEILAFSVGDKVTEATEPRALAALRAAFSSPEVELVELRVAGRKSRPTMAPWKPRGEPKAPLRAPFELARLREAGPRDGLLDVVGTVVSFGWSTLIDLPRATVASIRAPPTAEQKGWLLKAVRRDPWDAVRVFALVHAMLLFLNLVPLPPLDGFHLLSLGFETAARRPLPQAGLGIALRVGWAILILWVALNVLLILRDLISG